MDDDTLDIDELAAYLQRDLREVTKLAERGDIPGRKVGGRWRFARAEVTHWIEKNLRGYSDDQLSALEGPEPAADDGQPLVSGLLLLPSVAVPLLARTRSSVLRQLVAAAGEGPYLYDPPAVEKAVAQREELVSTALDSGVAIPHPRRPLPAALGESLIAYGRTPSGVPFGAPRGGLTDIFFLVCCQDDATHVRVLARLSRLLLRPGFIDDLRAAETPAATWAVIDAAERELVGP